MPYPESLSSERLKLMSMTTQEVVAITRETNFGTWRYQRSWNPLHIVDAKDCTITDAAGKQYLDFSSQLMCSNLGHKNPAVIASIAAQAEALAYAMPGYATTCRAELSQLLLEVLPEGLNSSSSPPPAPTPTKPPSKSPACTPASRRSSRATAAITGLLPAPSPPPATPAAGPWSPSAASSRASSSRPSATASAAPSATPTPAATSPAPTTSST